MPHQPGHIHQLRAKFQTLKFTHALFAILALIVSVATIKADPASTLVVLFLFFAFVVLLVIFEAYTQDRSVATPLLNVLTWIAPILFIAALSVSITFLVVGHPPGYVQPTAKSQPPPATLQVLPDPAKPAVPPPAVPPLVSLPERAKITSVYQEAGGCQNTARSFAVSIPHADRLDLNYSGTVAGIELVQTVKVADSGIQNPAFGNGAVTFDLYARGPGTVEHIPWPIDKDACIGASGGSVGYDVYAHYTAPH